MNRHPLHLKAVALSKNYINTERDLMATLGEIDRNKLFRTFGYSSLFQYVLSLGLTENQTYALITVSRKCEEVPELKTAIQSGEISVSKARRVVTVISQESASIWLEKARTLTSHALEREVRTVKPENAVVEKVKTITPEWSQLTLPIPAKLEQELKRLQNVLSQKHRRTKTLHEVLQICVTDALAKYDPVTKARRELSKHHPRHTINARDKGRCQAKLPNGDKCLSERFVEIHHILPRALGGKDEIENLITLCSNHHKWAHGRQIKRGFATLPKVTV